MWQLQLVQLFEAALRHASP